MVREWSLVWWLVMPILVAGTRPRGVRVELASFYNPNSDFSCLDGSGTIPFIQVNDDYCDCDDGSDEPGTSACPDGKFFCENKGHKNLVIPSSRVNDGICDCCDGSDEWESGSPCQDSCMELGREAREAAMAAAKLALEGFNIKQGMIKEAQLMQQERIQQISEKEKRKTELDALKEQRQKEKEAAEAPEKEALDYYRQLEEEERKKKEAEEAAAKDAEADKVFSELDTDGDGAVGVVELQANPALDTNSDGTVSEEEVRFFLSGADSFDKETFRLSGYQLLKPYLTQEEQAGEAETTNEPEILTPPPVSETPTPQGDEAAEAASSTPEVYDPWRANQPKEEIQVAEPEEYDDDEDKEEKDEEDYDVADQIPPPLYRSQIKDKVAEVAPEEEEKYDSKTRELIAAADTARRAFEEADRELRDVEREIKQIKDVLEKDYGGDGEYAVLSGQCFEFTDNEYTYKMCAFDYCSQRSKNGGSETRLGSWGTWVEDGDNKYAKMKFSGGQQCWNGPARSATVVLHCGTQNLLTAVSEPSRCEYEMHFTTPGACSRPTAPHDEL